MVEVEHHAALAPSRGLAPSRILVNAAYRTLADAGSKVAMVVLYVVMARRLGQSQFGVFSFGFSLAILVTTLANFGEDRVLVREVSQQRRRLDLDFPNTLALQAVLGATALLLASALLPAFGVEPRTRLVVALLGVAVVADLLTATHFAVYQGFDRMRLIPLVLVPQRFLTAVAGITALELGAGVVRVAAVYMAGSLLALPIAHLLLRRIARPRFLLNPRFWWPLLAAALPIGVAGVFATVLFRIDMVMLAAFEPKRVVGDYGAAYRLLEMSLFLSASVGSVVFPVFSRLAPGADLRAAFERGLKLVIAVTLPFALVALVLARHLLELIYGSRFGGGGTAVRLLAPTIALYPVSYISGYLLASQRRQRAIAVIYGAVALENLLGNLGLISAFSLNGAAVGTSISELLVALSLVIAAQRLTGVVRWWRLLAGPGLGSACAALVLVPLRDNVGLALGAGLPVYLVVLAVTTAVLAPEQARAAWHMLRSRL